MKIELKKITNYQFEYTITRNDQSREQITLETKTYLIHDICHFTIEKNLGYINGFWGMLSQGYSFNELYGKENPLTEELRFIEKIVGPIQSVFLGYIPEQEFGQYIMHLNFEITDDILKYCLTELKVITTKWEQLKVGEQLTLEFNLLNEERTTNR